MFCVTVTFVVLFIFPIHSSSKLNFHFSDLEGAATAQHEVPVDISFCDIQIIHEEKAFSSKLYESLSDLENLLNSLPILSSSFGVKPLKSLFSQQYPENMAKPTRYLYNCKLKFVFHVGAITDLRDIADPNNGDGFSTVRNPKIILLPTISEVSIETENTYIFVVDLKDTSRSILDLDLKFSKVNLKTFKSRMQSLRYQNFIVGLHEINPHHFKIGSTMYGTGYDLTIALSKQFNYTYSFSLVPHEVIEQENGIVRGWENEVANGHIDVDAFFVPNYVAHRPNLEYTTPSWKTSIIFLAKVPGHRTKWMTILGVLLPETWLALAAVTVVFSTAAYAKLKIAAPFYGEKKMDGPRVILALVYRSLISQGTGIIPKSTRGLALVWMFSCLVMTNYFCSNLLSLLTSPIADEKVPTDMPELAKRDDYTVFAMDHPGGPLEDYFNRSTTPHLVSIWKRTKLLPVPVCILTAITTPKTVCLGWDFIFEGILQANATINEQFNSAVNQDAGILTVYHSIILRKNTPYADAFNAAVGWFRDTGIYLGWLKQMAAITEQYGREWLTSPEQRNSSLFQVLDAAYRNSIQTQARPLELSYMIASFVILLFGSTLSLFALFGEYARPMGMLPKMKERYVTSA